MTLKQQIYALPKVKKAGFTSYQKKSLCNKVDRAVERLCGLQLERIWRKNYRPADLPLIAYAFDIIKALNEAKYPATYSVSNNRSGIQTTSLLIQLLDIGVAEARARGCNISAPSSGGWRERIKQVKKMHRVRPKRLINK